MRECRLGQGSAPQVCMENDSRRIDHALEREPQRVGDHILDGAVNIHINDAGATPGSVLLRLEQALI